ncbi:MAG: TetR/AcrR family transcriptional regulator [Bacteroidia bacterium]|nr:TetR/AcrR family transcriptional regulator [Bacteroidia bacterium]
MPETDNTEARILEAAKQVFYRKGLDGARMQEIADEAGINKAMLHYYFRTKEKLFDKIFLEALGKILPKIATTLGSDAPLAEKFDVISGYYHDLLLSTPYLPVFVVQTLQHNPDRLLQFIITQSGINPAETFGKFLMQIQQEVALGNIRPIDPRHLVLNLISMCVFPFMMRPMFIRIIGMKDEAFEAFVNERRHLVPQLIMQSIQPDQPPPD